MVRDILDKYKSSLTPIFVPIGGGEGEDSFSRQMVKELMENAIGMNVIGS
jgi:hypothetical protein